MANNIFEQMVVIGGAIASVALIAVLVSQKANTSGVLQSMGSSFAAMLNAATGPVTGGSSGGSSGTSISIPGISIG